MFARWTNWVAVGVAATLVASISPANAGRHGKQWVTIWGAMPQLTEPGNLPPEPFNATGVVFENSTIRQTVMVSLAAETVRLEISNAFGGSDLAITGVTVARPANQTAGTSGIQARTARTVTFSGSESFVVPIGAVAVSDAIDLAVAARSVVSVSIYLEHGQTGNAVTSHPGSRTTSYFAPGNHVRAASLADAASAEHWYLLSAVEGAVAAGTGARAVAIVGDSLTDGRGSTTNANDRWPDQLLARMQRHGDTARIAVVNQAAGGNRVLHDGLGPNALGRLDRDVLAHSGIRYAIIFEGVNDIGTAADDEASQQATGDRLIQAYQQMALRLHRHAIAVFGATLTPMTGPGQAYGTPAREKTRQRVNRWIRTSRHFDAVIDFDAAVRDPRRPDALQDRYDSGDFLHLNPRGYKAMADSIDLAIFHDFRDGV